MKRILTLIIVLQFTICGFTQWEKKKIKWDNKNREYLIHVPSHYNGKQKLAVVFTLHYLKGKAQWIYKNEFSKVAENKNAIIISPQALNAKVLFNDFGPCWNAGVGMYGVYLNEGVRDFEMMMSILDDVIAKYNIDESKVYATGFSMGGYMVNRLAIQSKGRIKKIASVAGTVGNGIKFKPTSPVSVLHFHGTKDPMVKYTNNDNGMDAEVMVNKWVSHNQCNTKAKKFTYRDRGDNFTFERYDYRGGKQGTTVSFIKAINAKHVWLHKKNNDINYNHVIWDFFFGDKKKSSVAPNNFANATNESSLNLYPNPARNALNVDYTLNCDEKVVIMAFNSLGQKVFTKNYGDLSEGRHHITVNVENYESGLYTFVLIHGNNQSTKRVLIK
ncbi:MAG: T9SS type A sorting domain-containing protein [Bacteroidales bacterium]|nr:T9SS type A sorting domain-containing protein [Bacteroidales bacterium]